MAIIGASVVRCRYLDRPWFAEDDHGMRIMAKGPVLPLLSQLVSVLRGRNHPRHDGGQQLPLS